MLSEFEASEGLRQRFEREIRIVAQLRDPHTVQLYAHGTTETGQRFMVFERVPGVDLAEMLHQRGTLDPETTVHIIRQVLESLSEAHELGIYHRDVKPGNIRIFESRRDPFSVKVLDFGIARPQEAEQEGLTMPGELLGTPRFMSPEQLLGVELTASSDLYSLGLVAFEMLMGNAQFRGNRWVDQVHRLRRGHEFAMVGVRSKLERTIQRMTAREPAERFQSADEVLEALARVLDSTVELDEFVRDITTRDGMPMLESDTMDTPTVVRDITTGDGRPMLENDTLRDEGASPTVALPEAKGTDVLRSGDTLLEPLPDRTASEAPALREPEPASRPRLKRRGRSRAVAARQIAYVATAAVVGALGAMLLIQQFMGPERSDADLAFAPTGCGSKEPIKSHSFTIRDGATSRSYGLRLPKDYNPAEPHPLLVVAQTDRFPTFGAREVEISRVADQESFISLDIGPATSRDMASVKKAIDSTVEATCVDLKRVYAVGRGPSSELIRELACTLYIAGIATVSTDASPACELLPRVPELVTTVSFQGWPPVVAREVVGCEYLSNDQRFGNCSHWSCGGAALAQCHVTTGEMGGTADRYPYMDEVWRFFQK